MPDAGKPITVLPEGETETLFTSADRVVGTAAKEFDMKGALYAIVLQRGTPVDNASRVTIGTPILWSTAAHDAAIDDNISNGVNAAPAVGTDAEMKIDFGSNTTRQPHLYGRVSINAAASSTTIRLSVSYSTDDISYTGEEVLITRTDSSGGLVITDTDVQGTSSSFRYIRILGQKTSGNGIVTAMVREIYNEEDTGGRTILSFEVFDTENSAWVSLPLTSAFAATDARVNGVSFVDQFNQLGLNMTNHVLFPSNIQAGTALLRAVLTTDKGKSDTSVVILKCNTFV